MYQNLTTCTMQRSMYTGEPYFRLADVLIVAYLCFAVVWPFVWDKLPRAAMQLRRLGLFHRWDMMLAPGTRGYSVVIELSYIDGSMERRELPANLIYQTCLANRLCVDRSLARHVLGVAMSGLWIDAERELVEARLVLVERRLPGLGVPGDVTTTDHVLAKGTV
jgi:hypothetical protein